MLARIYRLRQTRDIAQVYRRGTYSGGRDFNVKTLATGWPNSRAVIVVSKKVAKSAVTRNLIRRRLSGQLEALWQTVRPGYDIVISVQVDISALPPGQLGTELTKHLSRLGVTDKES
jgi:ribonuclease P protein component